MEKKEVLKFVVCGIICLFLGVGIGSAGKISSEEYKDLNSKYNHQVDYNTNLESEKETIEKELADLKEKTKSYIELNETEKGIVDAKIQEVRQATKEEAEAEQKRIAEERAQKEAEKQAQKEAEEQAKKEAEAHKYETGLTWEQIAREGKKGTLGQFEGKIIK